MSRTQETIRTQYALLKQKCAEKIPKHVRYLCTIIHRIDGSHSERFEILVKRYGMKTQYKYCNIDMFNLEDERKMFEEINIFADISLHSLAASSILRHLHNCGHVSSLQKCEAAQQLEVNHINKEELLKRIKDYNY